MICDVVEMEVLDLSRDLRFRDLLCERRKSDEFEISEWGGWDGRDAKTDTRMFRAVEGDMGSER